MRDVTPGLDLSLKFRYKNHEGKTAIRIVQGVSIRFWHGKSEYYEDRQWFMRAYDLEKKDWRDFAWNRIRMDTGN